MLAKSIILTSLLSSLFITAPVTAATGLTLESDSARATSSAPVQEKVNINHASAEQLARVLRGVGMARAQAIIELREQLGGFKDIEDLLKVRGLGVKVLEDNKERIEL